MQELSLALRFLQLCMEVGEGLALLSIPRFIITICGRITRDSTPSRAWPSYLIYTPSLLFSQGHHLGLQHLMAEQGSHETSYNLVVEVSIYHIQHL